jgi:hypothetical protein
MNSKDRKEKDKKERESLRAGAERRPVRTNDNHEPDENAA